MLDRTRRKDERAAKKILEIRWMEQKLEEELGKYV